LQLTLFVCAWMLVSPHMRDRWFVQVLLQLFLLNSVAVTLWANPQWHRIRWVMVAFWLASLAGSLLAVAPLPAGWLRWAHTAELASLLPVLALVSAGMLRYVFRGRQLTVDGLFATVAVYLLIALIFAQVYLLTLAWDPSSFDLPIAAVARAPQLLQGDMLYFSLITLATVGYGDILPVSETARTLAVLEAVVGQFYVAVIVAVFVGMFAAQRRD
jgi:voltage-gated potassium channel Kch